MEWEAASGVSRWVGGTKLSLGSYVDFGNCYSDSKCTYLLFIFIYWLIFETFCLPCTWLVRNLLILPWSKMFSQGAIWLELISCIQIDMWCILTVTMIRDFFAISGFCNQWTEILKVFLGYLSPQNVSSFVSTACRPSVRSDNHLGDCFTTWWLPIFEKDSISPLLQWFCFTTGKVLTGKSFHRKRG